MSTKLEHLEKAIKNIKETGAKVTSFSVSSMRIKSVSCGRASTRTETHRVIGSYPFYETLTTSVTF
jgi:hypothetical protein